MSRDIAAHTSEDETGGTKMTWRDVKDALCWHKIAIIVGNIFATYVAFLFSS
jgi:hypothetical protein